MGDPLEEVIAIAKRYCPKEMLSSWEVIDDAEAALRSRPSAVVATHKNIAYFKFREKVEELVFDPIRRGARTEAEILSQLKIMSDEHYAPPSPEGDTLREEGA